MNKSGEIEKPTKAVKIDRVIAMKAYMVAKDRNISLADYFAEKLTDVVERDWTKTILCVNTKKI